MKSRLLLARARQQDGAANRAAAMADLKRPSLPPDNASAAGLVATRTEFDLDNFIRRRKRFLAAGESNRGRRRDAAGGQRYQLGARKTGNGGPRIHWKALAAADRRSSRRALLPRSNLENQKRWAKPSIRYAHRVPPVSVIGNRSSVWPMRWLGQTIAAGCARRLKPPMPLSATVARG